MAPNVAAGDEAAICALAQQTLFASGRVFLRVLGGSMLPSVWPGDLLTIRRAEIADLAPGDLALCGLNARFVIHRVVANDGHRLITRGDAHASDDPPVPANRVLGKVVEMQRGRKRVPLNGEPRLASRLLGFVAGHSVRLKRAILHLHEFRLRMRRLQEPGGVA